MSHRFWLILLILVLSCRSFSQCLTDFKKLLPEPSTNYTADFGYAIAMYDDILAVGEPTSNDQGRIGGIVHLYKRVGSNWNEIGILEPSLHLNGLLFGYNIEMTKDYIIVGAYGYGGRVYIFKKPVTGWASGNEMAVLTQSNTSTFGASYRGNNALFMTPDQQTLLINDPFYNGGDHFGAVFIYHKNPSEEWSASITPVKLLAPENQAPDFGSGGIAVYGDRIACSTPISPTGIGSIYVFKDVSGNYTDFEWEARLAPSPAYPEAFFTSFTDFVFNASGIFATGVFQHQDTTSTGILFFQKPLGGWSNSNTPCVIYPPQLHNRIDWITGISSPKEDPDKIFFAFKEQSDISGKIVQLTSSGNWCQPDVKLVYQQPALPAGIDNYFAATIACDEHDNVAVARTPLPDNPTAQLGVKVLSKSSGDSWQSTSLFVSDKSTDGHRFGYAILGLEDYMFIGAPQDGTVKASGGTVYTYKKAGTEWTKTGKISPPFVDKYDDVFGTALAGQGDYLAVGATGFEPYGKILIYKKTSEDWSSVELIQEISPPASLHPYACGDNIAMTDRWLVIPVGTMVNGATISIMIYQFNGTTWDHFQTMDITRANLFARESTMAVDIDDETIVIGGTVIQRNAQGEWFPLCLLYPSDKEYEQIAPDFSHWITNGDLFGQSVDIQGDHIFIGAPTKDDGGTWDVGAIYVFVKQPGYNWSSGTETAKILPRVRNERELFGYSLRTLGNTLIAGAPGADYRTDGAARNQPGRAYIFQSDDFYWSNIIPLMDFTGDSFVKDYFGISVTLDSANFIISATIEDNQGDQLAGAVYTTGTPPLVRLLPPMCATTNTIDLLGYPFGGRWDGPGIVDPIKGTFDTQLAGIGIHELTYTTPSCHFPGRLKIEIKEGHPAIIEGDLIRVICESGQTSTTLNVTPQPDAFYHWYYRETESDRFTEIDGVSSSISVSQTGQYQAKVYNGSCESFSEPVIIGKENNPIQITPVPVICEKSIQFVSLQATPSGGTWSGNHISTQGVFNASNKLKGEYVVRYSIVSDHACNHFRDDVVKVDRVPTLNYLTSGNVCEGTAQVSLPVMNDITYHWMVINNGTPEFIGNSSNLLEVQTNGSYQALVSNAYCSETLSPILVNDGFTLQVFPQQNQIETCPDSPVTITAQGKPDDIFTWQYAEHSDDIFTDIHAHDQNLMVEKSGVYQVKVERGSCTFLSPVKEVKILPSDSLFVPNIITPNDDGKNDVFQVVSQKDYIDLYIFNRNGQRVFTGDAKVGWTGGDHASGVYFWYIYFLNCYGAKEERKGWVSLLR